MHLAMLNWQFLIKLPSDRPKTAKIAGAQSDFCSRKQVGVSIITSWVHCIAPDPFQGYPSILLGILPGTVYIRLGGGGGDFPLK